jgi:hypothetical protein
VAKLRGVVTSRLGERQTLEHAERLLPRMDAEVAALGRSTSARNVAAASEPQTTSPR